MPEKRKRFDGIPPRSESIEPLSADDLSILDSLQGIWETKDPTTISEAVNRIMNSEDPRKPFINPRKEIMGQLLIKGRRVRKYQ